MALHKRSEIPKASPSSSSGHGSHNDSESNLEFQKRTFPGRIKKQRRKNLRVLRERRSAKGQTSPTRQETARAQRSEKALGRVEKRLGLTSPKVGIPKTGKMARAAGELLDIAKKIGSAPGDIQRKLESVRDR